jgi:hypothetical protein
MISCWKHVYTGWGAQSWTVFCGSVAVAVKGCEQKDWRKLMGGGPKNGINVAVGTRAAVTLEMACRQTTTHSFAWKKYKMKIFKGLSNSQNMVFNVKKLLNIGVDLKLR